MNNLYIFCKHKDSNKKSKHWSYKNIKIKSTGHIKYWDEKSEYREVICNSETVLSLNYSTDYLL